MRAARRMRALHLDFQASRPPLSAWSFVVLALGLAAAAAVAAQFICVREELSSAQLQAENLKRKTLGAKALQRQPVESAAQQQLLRSAERLARELNTPWDMLLLDLESASDAPVALLSFEPDAQRRQLRLAGEAKSLADALAYVARLEGSVLLTEPRLLSHQQRQSEGMDVVGFTVLAQWDDPI